MQATLFSSWCREAKISFWNHSGRTKSYGDKRLSIVLAGGMTTRSGRERGHCSRAIGAVPLVSSPSETKREKKETTTTRGIVSLWALSNCEVALLLFVCARLKWHRYHRFVVTLQLTSYQQFQGRRGRRGCCRRLSRCVSGPHYALSLTVNK